MKLHTTWIFAVVLFSIFITPSISFASWTEEQKLTASDAAQYERFGSSVAILGDDVLVGAPNHQRTVDLGYGPEVVWTEPGAAYIFRRDSSGWMETQKLLADDGEPGDMYGGVVALHDNLAFVAAPRDDIDSDPSTVSGECAQSSCLGAGSVYVYERQGDGTYVFEQKLIASDGIRYNGRFSYFGSAIDLDGSYAVIGARGDDLSGSNTDYGSAYIFEQVGTNWVEQAKLTASDSGWFDYFGSSVAISGNIAMVGATQPQSLVDVNGQPTIVSNALPGKVYVFAKQGDGSWVEQAILTPSDGAGGDYFGARIALSGNTALISAPLHDEYAVNSGVIYVFENINGTWTETGKLTPSYNAFGFSFGNDLAMDGDWFVAGATSTTIGNVGYAGAAYLFKRDGGGSWSEQAKIFTADAAMNDHFGSPLDISGNSIIAGVPSDNPTGGASTDAPGAAYVFGFAQNSPPSADAGPDQTGVSAVQCTGAESATVILDGSGSSDPDGDTLSYLWSGDIGATGVSPAVNVSLGTHNVTLTVDDGNGATASDTVIVTVQDTLPPTVSVNDITLEANNPAGASHTITEGTGPGQYTASDSCSALSSVYITPTPASYPLGQTLVTVTATDSSGNSASADMAINVQDTTPPTLPPSPDLTVEATAASGAVVSFTTPTATDSVDPTPSVSCTPASGSTFALGGTFVGCTATDASGNSSSSSFIVTVVDTTAPVVTAPADVTVVATGPQTTVAIGTATATDAVGVVGITSDAPTTFPVGTTAVTWTASDAAGNSSSAIQKVTVTYQFGGFTKPVQTGGIYKLGRTLPVKFQLFYANGSIVSDAIVTLAVIKTSNGTVVGDPLDVMSTSAADSGNQFRISEDHYIYNLNTASYGTGTYRLVANVNNGASYFVDIAFK